MKVHVFGLCALLMVVGIGSGGISACHGEDLPRVAVVGHCGLIRHAPENTLAAFWACVNLRVGFELDVRKSREGELVCLHDETVDRTTDGRGAVEDRSLPDLLGLDAGAKFSPAFCGERIPRLKSAFQLLGKPDSERGTPTADEEGGAATHPRQGFRSEQKLTSERGTPTADKEGGASHPSAPGVPQRAELSSAGVLVAVDLKAAGIEADVVAVAQQQDCLHQLLFIGNAIGDAKVREQLRKADPKAHVACLANTSSDLAAAIADRNSDWVYLRFIPQPDEVEHSHKAGKRVFIAGPTVAGLEREAWKRALAAGTDGILTDYPLELAAEVRLLANPQTESKSMDQLLENLVARFLDQYPGLSPVAATAMGDHRLDAELDEISDAARNREREFFHRYLAELAKIDRAKLTAQNQVDWLVLSHHLQSELWSRDKLQEWAWNPVQYSQLGGGAVYSLMQREFAPVEQRLQSVAARLEKFPRLYQQIRQTLVPQRVPLVHAETASKQNRGVLSIIDNMVKPHLDKLNAGQRERLLAAIATATKTVEEHQQWLDKELLPKAGGNFRIGPALFDEKLAFTLGTDLGRSEIRARAESELRRVRSEMYGLARGLLAGRLPAAELPEDPTPEQQQKAIEAALRLASAEVPPRDGVVAAAENSMKITTDFVRSHDLATIPPDPLDIIVMPEFQRGVSVAYCDSPGPLEVGQKTFYAVAPLPADWTDTQCDSFLREYNIRSIHNLTVHEAMPGHFLQIAQANRSPNRLRSVLSSGVFVEGWACYTEQMMSEEGFLDRDPLMRLVTLKWYLRTIANVILDQSLHVDGIGREDAMRLMMRDTFQEEREAAGKWTRAQLTSAQLSTYFVGFQEHHDLREAAKAAWGKDFSLKRYHDGVVSFGSPPTRFVRALLLKEPLPKK